MIALGALLGNTQNAGHQVIGPSVQPTVDGVSATDKQNADKSTNDTQKDSAGKLLNDALQQQLAAAFPSVGGVQSVAPANAVNADSASGDQDFSPAAVAGRVIGFVQQRLDQEKANGASSDALQQRLQQGLDGIRKGMADARKELEARGIFDGKVRDDYFETLGRLQKGMDGLKQALSGDGSGVEKADATTITRKGKNGLASMVTSGASGTNLTQGVAISDSRDFSLEVKTRDGDVVKINVSSARALQAASTQLQSGNVDASGVAAQLSGEDNFSFTVEGELDDGEMKALNDLFSQVNDVASTFYGGDVESAFNQALSVGYDQTELVGFAANMTQTQTVAVTQAYADVAQAGGGDVAKPSLGNALASLGDFIRQVRSADSQLPADGTGPIRNIHDLFKQLLTHLPRQGGDTSETTDGGTKGGTTASEATDSGSGTTNAASVQSALSYTGLPPSAPLVDAVDQTDSTDQVGGVAEGVPAASVSTANATTANVTSASVADTQSETSPALAWRQFIDTVLGGTQTDR